MKDAHAELCKSAQERQLLCADLAGTEPRYRIVAVFVLDGLEAQREDLQRCVPVDRFELAIRVAQVRCRCAIRRT
jgi:hypothetical protein